ncbi:WD40-repeat-containing domain protein [Bisporella sp. PMI_857]|nr:WD40-repeat-containing domain protein [Bisporella sp. PMI_857]
MTFPSKPLTQLLGSIGPVHALTYSSSPSTYILTGSSDRSIRLYNPSRAASSQAANGLPPPKNAQLIQTYSAHGYEVLDISVAADNASFASVGGDRTVFLWDVATAQTIKRFSGNFGHSGRINTVSFAGSGDSVLVTGSFDATVKIWDLKSNSYKPIMTLDEAKDSVSCVLAGAGGEYEIVSGSVDGRVRYYDMRMGKLETDVVGASVTSLQRTRDGNGILVGCLDSCIRLLDRDGGGLLRSYKADGWKNDEYRLRSCFGANERWVLSGNEKTPEGKDGEVVVWDTLSGELIHRVRVKGSDLEGKKKIGSDGQIKGRENVISCVAWKKNGRGDQWCCAGTDGIVTVFGPET